MVNPEKITFKERVCKEIIDNVQTFHDTFLDYDYLICSRAFPQNFHIITANETNYLHLTGVYTNLLPAAFYEKSFKGTLTINDFDFLRKGATEKSVKGTVRKKIYSLPLLRDFLSKTLTAEDGFKANKVANTFSISDKTITIAFVQNGNPMSLLKGDRLNKKHNLSPVELVFRKAKGTEKFSEVIFGESNLAQYESFISQYI